MKCRKKGQVTHFKLFFHNSSYVKEQITVKIHSRFKLFREQNSKGYRSVNVTARRVLQLLFQTLNLHKSLLYMFLTGDVTIVK